MCESRCTNDVAYLFCVSSTGTHSQISPSRSPRPDSAGQHATHSIASAMVSEALVANVSRGHEQEADADSEKVELGLLHTHPSRHVDNDEEEYL